MVSLVIFINCNKKKPKTFCNVDKKKSVNSYLFISKFDRRISRLLQLLRDERNGVQKLFSLMFCLILKK